MTDRSVIVCDTSGPVNREGGHGRVRLTTESGRMLHCNMNLSKNLQLGLDDLLADLRHARRRSDLGRLALMAYCDVRRWARLAAEPAIADHCAAMFTATPHASKEAFIVEVDRLIAMLEQAQSRLAEPNVVWPLHGSAKTWAAGAGHGRA